jgi:hypothetical protein
MSESNFKVTVSMGGKKALSMTFNLVPLGLKPKVYSAANQMSNLTVFKAHR